MDDIILNIWPRKAWAKASFQYHMAVDMVMVIGEVTKKIFLRREAQKGSYRYRSSYSAVAFL